MLDTNIIIYLRGHRSERVESRLATMARGEAVMSVITYGELRHGAEKSLRRERALLDLEEMIAIVPVAGLPIAAATEYGAIKAELERHGQLIGANDLWIAAHARSAGLTLVTNNEREFRRVPGLKIENWALVA